MIRVQSLIHFPPFKEENYPSVKGSDELFPMVCEDPAGLSWRNHFKVAREVLGVACSSFLALW